MLAGKACHPAAFFPISLGNFLNVKITVKCYTLTLLTSNLKILLISSCSFHFWYLFRTITIFHDWQGHVTRLCKRPIVTYTRHVISLYPGLHIYIVKYRVWPSYASASHPRGRRGTGGTLVLFFTINTNLDKQSNWLGTQHLTVVVSDPSPDRIKSYTAGPLWLSEALIDIVSLFSGLNYPSVCFIDLVKTSLVY